MKIIKIYYENQLMLYSIMMMYLGILWMNFFYFVNNPDSIDKITGMWIN
jgi:hypothetical protein